MSGPIRGEYGGQLTNHSSPGPGFPAPPPRHGLGDDEGSEGLEPVLQTILDSVVLAVWAECVLGPFTIELRFVISIVLKIFILIIKHWDSGTTFL